MIATVYRLTAPGMIEPCCRELSPAAGGVLLRPFRLSVCRADQRYYQGQRSPEALKAKLPMALLHECCAEVICDPSGQYRRGELVVPVPNLPAEADPFIAENYLFSSRFRSSGYDGYLQEYFMEDPARLVRAPKGVKPEVCAFLELVSVSMHAIRRFEGIAHNRRERLAVWGDGNLGYITALLLRAMYPKARLLVLGTVAAKLALFSFADRALLVDDLRAGARETLCDHAFECVGGGGCQPAINQMIDVIAPEGTMALLGVSENLVGLNTRMVLEKGLRLFGSSRSGLADFQQTAALLAQSPRLAAALEQLVGEIVPIRAVADIHTAFRVDAQHSFGKTVLSFLI
ncbi:MAG: ribitol-5-phosphate dehydrogenase [Oscillospiraceae bacterium]|jgi:ribitol-5-phosphate 2-dehydrogenase|nr:ribitol-5-phosphate dehydrogenase [Oscillospiraceae bacterium]